jgi:superfamily II DNA/RNA helicase
MERFRKHQIQVLVATDLASRGIDVSAISHIINYDIPPDPHVYVHRIGRTARMGARGTAITFVTSEQGKELTQVEKLINREVKRRHVEGFTPGEARPRMDDHRPAPPQRSRLQTPVYAETSATAAGPAMTPRTLGSRFKPKRGRRRL